MTKRFIAGLLGVAALGAGSTLVIFFATRPGGPAVAGGGGVTRFFSVGAATTAGTPASATPAMLIPVAGTAQAVQPTIFVSDEEKQFEEIEALREEDPEVAAEREARLAKRKKRLSASAPRRRHSTE